MIMCVGGIRADVGTVVNTVWKRPAGVVGGTMLSLDDIENVKLRAPEVRR